MYNRYIPNGTSYTRVEVPDPPQERHKPEGKPGGTDRRPGGQTQPGTAAFPGGFRPPKFLTGKDGLASLFTGREGAGGLLKALKLDSIDKGDVLLLLIILFLLAEGDDLELVIALGLVLLMGLGDKEGKRDAPGAEE